MISAPKNILQFIEQHLLCLANSGLQASKLTCRGREHRTLVQSGVIVHPRIDGAPPMHEDPFGMCRLAVASWVLWVGTRVFTRFCCARAVEPFLDPKNHCGPLTLPPCVRFGTRSSLKEHLPYRLGQQGPLRVQK